MPFFCYCQNNTGGDFEFRISEGITHYVIVEAADARAANARAESIGLYWDGCDKGVDCPCCGDRWYAKDDHDAGDESPMAYGSPVAEIGKRKLFSWEPNGDEMAIHRIDGSIQIVNVKAAA